MRKGRKLGKAFGDKNTEKGKKGKRKGKGGRCQIGHKLFKSKGRGVGVRSKGPLAGGQKGRHERKTVLKKKLPKRKEGTWAVGGCSQFAYVPWVDFCQAREKP